MLAAGAVKPSSNLLPAPPLWGSGDRKECKLPAQVPAFGLEHKGASINSSPEVGLGATQFILPHIVDCLWSVSILSSVLPSLLPPSIILFLPDIQ